MLAIASGELIPGKRLPSTRALAKRLRLTVNTVSAAYHQLEMLGWVESIRGSGVYVRARQSESEPQADILDRLIVPFVRSARSGGFSAEALRDRVNYWLAMRPRRFVFVHPEPELRAIIVHELRSAMSWTIEDCGTHRTSLAPYLADSVFVTVPSKQRTLRAVLPSDAELIALEARPVDQVLRGYLPISAKLLIAVASGWRGFLEIARTVLTAAGCDAEFLLLRDTNANGWDRGLETASVVICDAVTAQLIPNRWRTIVFPLVSDASIARLKSFERFYCD